MIEQIKEDISKLPLKNIKNFKYTYRIIECGIDAKKIISMSDLSFSLKEKLTIFGMCMLKTFLFMLALSLLYGGCVKHIAEALFYVFDFPMWMLPGCLFIAARKSKEVLHDFFD